MRLFALAFLMTVPTPPGILLLYFLVTFFVVHDLLKIGVDILSEMR